MWVLKNRRERQKSGSEKWDMIRNRPVVADNEEGGRGSGTKKCSNP